MDISYIAQPRRMQSDIDALVHLHRRVMLIILLDDLRLLAADMESDAMDITTRAFEPELLQCEQRSFFTFSKLLTREQARHTTVQILLNSVVEYIFNTWGLTFAAQRYFPHLAIFQWNRLCSGPPTYHQQFVGGTWTILAHGPGRRTSPDHSFPKTEQPIYNAPPVLQDSLYCVEHRKLRKKNTTRVECLLNFLFFP